MCGVTPPQSNNVIFKAEDPFLFVWRLKRVSPALTELLFGEERSPSAGKRVELKTMRKRGRRRERKSGREVLFSALISPATGCLGNVPGTE